MPAEEPWQVSVQFTRQLTWVLLMRNTAHVACPEMKQVKQSFPHTLFDCLVQSLIARR